MASLNKAVKDYIATALKTLKPPEKLTVSEWAEKKRVLDSKTSAEPGKWRNSRTPYLVGIMDAFNDYQVEEIIFVKPTQVGGTETLLNMIGYIIDQDPSPTLLVDPNEQLAKYTSINRVQPMINLCPTLKDSYLDDKSKALELQFNSMYVSLSGANSASNLASKPIRFLLMDEVDKYPPCSKKEADPRSLARERTKTFAHNKKIYQASTPTTKYGAIWEEYETCDTQYHYYVPCPKCGHMQILDFKQVKYDKKSKDTDTIRHSTYYECKKCKAHLTDSDKYFMLKKGQWQTTSYNGKRKIGFHLNSLYSPWVRFGDMAVNYVESKGYLDKLQNFYNSGLGEPFELVKQTTDEQKLLNEHQSIYTEGIIPDDTFILTGGVDVQRDSYYFTIRAWGKNFKSYNVTHGHVLTWEEVDEAMNAIYLKENGEQYQVELGCVDSGDQTQMVYELCAISSEWAIPIKGTDRKMYNRYKISTVKKEGIAEGMQLVTVDGSYYKDLIFSRISVSKENEELKGGWYVYDGCDLEYCKMMCAEHKVMERRGGVNMQVWKPKGSHIDNHYLDCEVYCTLAADLMNIREMEE